MFLKNFLIIGLLITIVHSYGEDCAGNQECLTYANALNQARFPTSARENNNLRPLRPSHAGLTFDAEGRVLLARVDNFRWWQYNEGDLVTTSRQGWYTAYPDLQRACKKFAAGTDKVKRIQQLLGLPPTRTFDGIIEVFVPLSGIFRPCPDPEIYDSQCVSEIPVLNTANRNTQRPWYCPVDAEDVTQIGEKYVNVVNDHFKWMCNTWNGNYNNAATYSNYPWTGLGYTYDWGTKSGIGLSEYIVDTGVKVVFKRRVTVDEYCKK